MMLMPIRSLGKRNSLKGAVPKVMSVALRNHPSTGSGTTRRNDCYSKCGGFDKLNHRNANLLDNPFSFLQSVFCTFQCIKHKTHISEASSAERLKWLDKIASFVQKLTKFLQSVFCTFQCVKHEHRNSHWSYSAWNWGDEAGCFQKVSVVAVSCKAEA